MPPETELLGLPIVRRTALAARRAGFSRVAVAGASPESPLARALEGADVERLAAGAPAPEGAVVLPWNRVLRAGEVRQLAAGRPASELGVVLASEADRPAAERWLLQGLIRDTEGFMSRHFERPVSLAVSRRLADTAVTPNQMTLVSVAIGLFGALFFLSQRPALQTVGALAFLLHSILDGCDGELARLKLQESRFGGVLDFWGDNVVHAAIFGCMAIGWSRAARRRVAPRARRRGRRGNPRLGGLRLLEHDARESAKARSSSPSRARWTARSRGSPTRSGGATSSIS